jgi:hypothetical protein
MFLAHDSWDSKIPWCIICFNVSVIMIKYHLFLLWYPFFLFVVLLRHTCQWVTNIHHFSFHWTRYSLKNYSYLSSENDSLSWGEGLKFSFVMFLPQFQLHFSREVCSLCVSGWIFPTLYINFSYSSCKTNSWGNFYTEILNSNHILESCFLHSSDF